MLQLVVHGPEPRQRWRASLEPGKCYTLGRGTSTDLPVPWETFLSRCHARLTVGETDIRIESEPSAVNGLFVDGEQCRQAVITAGNQFVVGKTRFRLCELALDSSSRDQPPVEELVFSPQQLDQIRFQDADDRLEALRRLPGILAEGIGSAVQDERLASVVLSGIRHADAVAIIESNSEGDMHVRHWDRRTETAGLFRPSRKLTSDALHRRRGTVLHLWQGSDSQHSDYTATAEIDWAFCTPLSVAHGVPWGIYVAGRLDAPWTKDPLGSPPALQADVKFTELVGEFVRSAMHLGLLERRLALLRQFLSAPVVEALERMGGEDLDADLLEPRECSVTVLFCDLRGFSQQAEDSAEDLTGLLTRVSSALGIMTDCILRHGGVTGEFLGDATLGFWGWPFASEEAPLHACRAALAIRRAFQDLRTQTGHPLSDFEVGIGIAHGRAMAGKIGTGDRVTVTVFGPVVNLASRLESLTRQMRVPILLDEATARILRQGMSPAEARTRHLAKVLPYGMETPLMVSELLPPYPESELSDDLLEQYEAGVAHFLNGAWEEAYRALHAMPPSDRAQDFLTLRIAQHNRTAPPDWDGIIRISGK